MSATSGNNTTPGSGAQLTENERWLLVAAFKNLKGKFEVDWDAVVNEDGCPYKNKASITVTFGRLKREKLGLGGGTSGNTDTPSSRKKSTVGSGTNNTPSKITKSGGGRKKSALNAADTSVRRNLAAEFAKTKMEQSDDDESPTKMATRGHRVNVKYEEDSGNEGTVDFTEASADPNYLTKAETDDEEYQDANTT